MVFYTHEEFMEKVKEGKKEPVKKVQVKMKEKKKDGSK